MSSRLISKSSIRDNIIFLYPHEIKKSDTLVYISHGSGGLGEGEWDIASFFLKNNYQVALLDYFSCYNIHKLFWDYRDHNQDHHTTPFKTLFDNAIIPDFDKIIHIGCSLGGFFGIHRAKDFTKNYCFYPGMLAFTKFHIENDYRNTTVIVGKKDNWCDNYQTFHNSCLFPPKLIEVDAYHGFMNTRKNVKIPVAKYHLAKNVCTDNEFAEMIPNHKWLSTKFTFEKSQILLRGSKKEHKILLNLIHDEISIL